MVPERTLAGSPPTSPARLRIGCVFESQNRIICRVLHTQVLEVMEFAVPKGTLKIFWAFAAPGTTICLVYLGFRPRFSFSSARRSRA